MANPSKPAGWFHIILNYIGANDGEGIRIYINGEEVATSATKTRRSSSSAGDGGIVVGRYYTDQDWRYATMQIDELVYFNQTLSEQGINTLAAAP